MSHFRVVLTTLLFVTCTICDLIPRTTTSYSNSSLVASTLTSNASISSPVCCWLAVDAVNVQVWYVSSAEITVATVITQTYQYNDTKIVNYTTVTADYTRYTEEFDGSGLSTPILSGLPTDIIVAGGPYAVEMTTIVYGTAVTDPYGNVIQSPTPFFIFGSEDPVTYQSATATMNSSDTSPQCPKSPYDQEDHMERIDTLGPYPSGLWVPIPIYDGENTYLWNQTSYFEDFGGVPQQLMDYMQNNIRPGASSFWSSVSDCKPGNLDGQPTAHIPVNEITGSSSTTIMVPGNYNAATTTTTSKTPTPTQTLPPSSTQVLTRSPFEHISVPATETNAIKSTKTSTLFSTSDPQQSSRIITDAHRTSHIQSTTSTPQANASKTKESLIQNTATTITAGEILPLIATAVVIDSQTQAFSNTEFTPSPNPVPIFTAGSTTYNANSATAFLIGDSSLTPGGTAIASSTTYILPSSPTAIIINGVTQTLQNTQAVATTNIIPIFTAGGSTYSANSATEFIVGSQTLTAGGTLITDSTTYILPNNPTAIIINGNTQALQSTTSIIPTQSLTHLASLILDSTTYKANSASDFVIGTQTLTPGGVITNSAGGGEIISLSTGPSGSSAAVVVIESGSVTTTSSLGLGGIIASIGGFASVTSTPASDSISTSSSAGSVAASTESTNRASNTSSPSFTSQGVGNGGFFDLWVMRLLLAGGLGVIWVL